MIEPTGYTALDLVGFTDRGTYAANVNYVKNDLVHYGGNIWRILIDDTIGITPAEGTNYTLFIGEPTNLIERIIAPLEDNPATVAYQTGRQIIYNDYLYEVIDDIAVGDILIAYEDDPTNANIKLAPPVETQVLALNASKVNKSDVVNNVTTTTAGKVLDARQGKALQDGKADNSVIAPVESGTTASRAYAAGEHFIKNGAFCTAKTAIAQGEAFTLNTNYTASDVGNVLLNTNKATHYHIANGFEIFKVGRVCVMELSGADATPLTLPTEIRPQLSTSAIVRGTQSNSTRQVCLTSVLTNGEVSTSYFIPNTGTASSFSGMLNGNITYISVS